MWSELSFWKERLAEGLSGLSQDRASGPCCMKAFLTLSASFLKHQRWSVGSKPYPSAALIHLSSVPWQGGNNRNQEGGAAVLFLKQPFRLPLPTSFPLCNGGVWGSGKTRSGVRGSSDAGAALPGEQAERKAVLRRMTQTNLRTVLLKQDLASLAPLVPSLALPVPWAQESEEAVLLLSVLNNSHSSAVAHKHPSPNAFTIFLGTSL